MRVSRRGDVAFAQRVAICGVKTGGNYEAVSEVALARIASVRLYGQNT